MVAPVLTQYNQGKGAVSADMLNTFVQSCDSLSQLRSFIGLPGIQVEVRGTNVPNDGGQGVFYWNANASSPVDDNTNTIVPPSGGSGCWTRLTGATLAPLSCIASGANAISLSGVVSSPGLTAYANYQLFTFVTTGPTTGAVTIQYGNLPAVPLYLPGGNTQAGNGSLPAGLLVVAAYQSTLNLAGTPPGGMVIISSGVGGAGSFVSGPGTTVVGDIATWSNNIGSQITDSGVSVNTLLAFGVQGTFKNLLISNSSVTPYSTINISADAVMLSNGAGQYFVATNVSVNPNINNSGANGLDTSTVGSSTWYYAWVIYNGSTLAGLWSLSSTAPTMPSGYTFRARVGAMYVNNASQLMQTTQRGRSAQYIVSPSANTTKLPVMSSGPIGTYSATAPVYAAIPISTFVPPTAGRIYLCASNVYNGGTGGAFYLAPNANYAGYDSTNAPPASCTITTGAVISAIEFVIESTNVYWVATVTAGLLCLGWEDNL